MSSALLRGSKLDRYGDEKVAGAELPNPFISHPDLE